VTFGSPSSSVGVPVTLGGVVVEFEGVRIGSIMTLDICTIGSVMAAYPSICTSKGPKHHDRETDENDMFEHCYSS